MVNLIVDRGDDHVLMVRYDPTDEAWWLPGAEVEPYQHPDDAAEAALIALGITDAEMSIANIQSFRGRRGWHLTFDYLVDVDEDVTLAPEAPEAGWFHPDDLPATKHGRWEADTIQAVLADDDEDLG